MTDIHQISRRCSYTSRTTPLLRWRRRAVLSVFLMLQVVRFDNPFESCKNGKQGLGGFPMLLILEFRGPNPCSDRFLIMSFEICSLWRLVHCCGCILAILEIFENPIRARDGDVDKLMRIRVEVPAGPLRGFGGFCRMMSPNSPTVGAISKWVARVSQSCTPHATQPANRSCLYPPHPHLSKMHTGSMGGIMA